MDENSIEGEKEKKLSDYDVKKLLGELVTNDRAIFVLEKEHDYQINKVVARLYDRQSAIQTIIINYFCADNEEEAE